MACRYIGHANKKRSVNGTTLKKRRDEGWKKSQNGL